MRFGNGGASDASLRLPAPVDAVARHPGQGPRSRATGSGVPGESRCRVSPFRRSSSAPPKCRGSRVAWPLYGDIAELVNPVCGAFFCPGTRGKKQRTHGEGGVSGLSSGKGQRSRPKGTLLLGGNHWIWSGMGAGRARGELGGKGGCFDAVGAVGGIHPELIVTTSVCLVPDVA